MKNFYIVGLFVVSAVGQAYSQSTGINNINPHPNAALDVRAVGFQGFAPPRFSTNVNGSFGLAGADGVGIFYYDTLAEVYRYYSGAGVWKTFGGLTGILPAGTTGQTLRHNGTDWVANSLIYNDGSNVGIGTTGPSQKLHIITSAGTGALRLESNSAVGITLKNQVAGLNAKNWVITNSGQTLGFGALNDAESAQYNPMVIDRSGFVGINTPTPTVRLEIRGTSSKTSNFYNNILKLTTDDSSNPLALFLGLQSNTTATSRYGLIDVDDEGVKRNLVIFTGSAGNVGIGITTPQAQLHTTGTVRFAGLGTVNNLTGYNLAAVNTTTGQLERYTGTLPGDNLGNHTATQNIDLATNLLVGDGGTEGLMIDAGGFVGIGTATPSSRLHVETSDNQAAIQVINTNGIGVGIDVAGGSSLRGIELLVQSSLGDGASGIRMDVNGEGNNSGLFVETSTGTIGADATGLIVRSYGDPNGDNAVAAVFEAGSVGIGDYPDYLFDVKAFRSTYVARIQNQGEGAGLLVQRQSAALFGNPALRLEINDNSDNNVLLNGNHEGGGALVALSRSGVNRFVVGNDGNLGVVRGVNYLWPLANGSGVLTNNGSGTLTWSPASSGTVTSVGLSLPAELSVTGSPVTSSGTLSATWVPQNQNAVFAAPSASDGIPSFRLLEAADIPNLNTSKITAGTLPTARGGTGAALTAVNGGVVYSTATGMAISAAGTAGQVLRSNGAAAPSWTDVPTGTGTADYLVRWTGVSSMGTGITRDDGANVGIGAAPSSFFGRLYVSANGNSNAIRAEATTTGTNNTGLLGLAGNATNNAIGVEATATGTSTTYGLSATANGTGVNAFGARVRSIGSATNSYGLYAEVSAGTNRYAGVFIGGNVGIGTATPASLLHLRGMTPTQLMQAGDNLTTAGTTIANIDFADNFSNTGQARISAIREEASIGVGDLPTALTFSTIKDGNDITGLSERMRISSSGFVGIGTDAPTSELDINGAIRIRGSSPAAGRVLTAVDALGNASWQNLPAIPSDNVTGTGAATRVAFWNGANTLSSNANLYWDNTNGRLGLGTSIPFALFDVRSPNLTPSATALGMINVMSTGAQNADLGGSITLGGNYNTGGTTYRVFASIEGRKENNTDLNSRGYLSLKTTGTALTEAMRIDADGHVGIGTPTPGKNAGATKYLSLVASESYVAGRMAAFEIQGSSNASNAVIGRIDFNNILTGPTVNNLARIEAFQSTSFAQGGLRFYTNAGTLSEAMRIQPDGRVGIGVLAPLAQLDMRTSNVTTTSATPGNLNVMTTDPQGIDVGGSVSLGGFNNDAATTLRVFGTIEGRKTNATTGSSSGYLSFKTNNAGTLAEAMRITHDNRVGIGTTAPAEALEVVGNIQIPAANEYQYATAKTKILVVPATAFVNNSNTSTSYGSNGASISFSSGGGSLFAPLNLPIGAVITNLKWVIFDNDNTNSNTGALQRLLDGGVTPTLVASSTSVDNGSVNNHQSNPAHTVLGTNAYWLRWTSSGTSQILYMCIVTYTVTQAE